MGVFSRIFGKPPPPVPSGSDCGIPLHSVTWERSEDWGILKLLHASRDAVLWSFQMDGGTTLPIHRHEFMREVVSVTDGSVKVLEFNQAGEQVDENLLLAGDSYRIPPERWHQIETIRDVAIVTVLHIPMSYEICASVGDVEEWRPVRVMGRG